MLDKSKVYVGFSRPYKGRNQSPSKRFKKVKILYEDEISFYVESLTEKDQRGFGKRYSIKKHVFNLIELTEKVVSRTSEVCITCPLYLAHQKLIDKNWRK